MFAVSGVLLPQYYLILPQRLHLNGIACTHLLDQNPQLEPCLSLSEMLHRNCAKHPALLELFPRFPSAAAR